MDSAFPLEKRIRCNPIIPHGWQSRKPDKSTVAQSPEPVISHNAGMKMLFGELNCHNPS
jgi:hypothetical protein